MMSLDEAGCATGMAVDQSRALDGQRMLDQRWLSEVANRPSDHIVSVKYDLMRSARWAVVVDCDHPEWPARILLLPKTSVAGDGFELKENLQVMRLAAEAGAAVQAGAPVRVWRRDKVSSIEAAGIAEESGAVGKRIRVRMRRKSMDGQESVSYVLGVVRGLGELEIVQ